LTRSPRAGLLEAQAPPRVNHSPRRTHANDWEVVSDLSSTFGVVLDEWQEVVMQAAMGVRSDGRWSTPQVAVSTPRQNGKSQLIVARALAGILAFEEKTIIVSAHQQDTAREVFTRLVDLIETHPALEARVAERGIMRALNRESIRFKSGQVIRFKARSTGGGRGFSCDCLLLDEAQILSAAAWAAILPTKSARPNAQVWLFGTPPTPQDDGEVFSRFRSVGVEGKSSRIAYLEWSASPGDDLDDEEVWAKANPSFGFRIMPESIADERATMSDSQFALERLGMWDEALTHAVIDPSSWAEVADVSSVAFDRLALAVDVSPDRSIASVSLAGQRADGMWHLELDEQRNGVGWLVPWLVARCARNDIRAVVIDGMSPAASIIDDLRQHKIKVTTTSSRDMAAACGTLYDGVMEGWLRHTDQPQVNVALSVARRRPLQDAWAWNRKNAASDITPLVACTLALWGAQSSTVKKPTHSGRRKVVVRS
jgi:hypothetical protein